MALVAALSEAPPFTAISKYRNHINGCSRDPTPKMHTNKEQWRHSHAVRLAQAPALPQGAAVPLLMVPPRLTR
jgi:hypothetical protein